MSETHVALKPRPLRTAAEVRALLGQQEGLRLEFKEPRALGRLEDLGKHATAMANGRGGTIVIGVDEIDPPAGRSGSLSTAGGFTPVEHVTVEAARVSTFLAQRVSPMLPDCEVVAIEDVPGTNTGFIVIDVGESIRGHMSPDVRFYRRHSFGVVPLDERELRELLGLSQRADLSLVLIDPHTFGEAAPSSLVGTDGLVFGVKNSGAAAEIHYRVQFALKGVKRVASLYGPDGNTDHEHLPRRDPNGLVFTSTAKYAAFPDAVVTILRAEQIGTLHAGVQVPWLIVGATTPKRSGTIEFA